MRANNQQKKTFYSIEDIHVPTADKDRDSVNYKALLNALDEIDKAKKSGKYS